MKYLFFDIECCDGKHICEFGYLFTDDKFNILERACIPINPEKKFKLSAKGKESDIQLAFTEEEYYSSPKFSEVYNRVKAVIETPNCQIVGFSMGNDSGFLQTACDRYGLKPITFTFLDFQKLYRCYAKEKNVTSIKKLTQELGIENITFHKSDDDAFATMLFLKKVCEIENLSVKSCLEFLVRESQNYGKISEEQQMRELIERAKKGGKMAQKQFTKLFTQRLNYKKPKESQVLGLSFCISTELRRQKFNWFLTLIDNIYKQGGSYSADVCKCKSYIDFEGDEKHLIIAKEAKLNIISLESALKLLGLEKEDLDKRDYITLSSIYSVKKGLPARKKATVTIKEILKSKKDEN